MTSTLQGAQAPADPGQDALDAREPALDPDQELLQAAVASGQLPAERRIPDALALKLVRDIDPSVSKRFAVRIGEHKTLDVVQGMLDSRPHSYVPMHTTLQSYAGIPAVVKIWPSAQQARDFVEYESAAVRERRVDPAWSTALL